jgi:signal transduction histidine kinase/ActR/RegA family two-component response regulator
MRDAGRVESVAPPSAPAHAHIGPMIPAHAALLRYGAAVAIVLAVFAVRAALAPLLGVQAPLLPFLLAVMMCAYVSGRGPALLAGAITPLLATLWFTNWPLDAPPAQWLAHVSFFLVLAVLTVFIMDALQRAVRRADASARLAEQANEALREADRRKDEFLAMLAHELRNPLTPIRNVAHILGRAPGADSVKRASEMLARQANHLTHLVDDLLDVARITHRRVELKRDVVKLEDLAAMAVESQQSTLDSRRQLVTINVTAADVHVDGDVVRLCQVLSNLLANASKYSPEGKRIDIDVGGDDAQAVLSVRDEGSGIDPQLLPRLFDVFMQGDRSLDRAQGGLGIGLTIVKHLVDMHGGTVEAASEGVGKGSEFRIRLPRCQRPLARAPAQTPEGRGRRRRVLVVDDNRDCADSLQDLLSLEGHEVQVVHDGPAALATLDGYAADVVLLDVGLPHMDGYMVAHAIHAKFGSRPRPRIIALTGYGSSEDKRSASRSGVDDHLTKPVEPEHLLKLLNEEQRSAMRDES